MTTTLLDVHKRSLRTHCPIMLREHTEGHCYDEIVCRCDVAHIKTEIHPTRCKSTGECPVRKHLREQGEKVSCNYELL